MQIVRRAVRAEVAMLAMVEKPGEFLVLDRARGRRDNDVRGRRIPFGRGAIGVAARRQRPVLVNGPTAIKRFSVALEGRLGLKPHSIIAVPVRRHGELVGVLSAVNGGGRDPFGKNDLEIVDALGDHIALAIVGSRLSARVKRMGLEYSRLAQVSADVGKSLTLDEVLKRIIKNLDQLIPFDAAAIFLNDPEKKTITSVLHQGYPKDAGEKIHVKIHEGIVGLAARSKKGIIVGDVKTHPRYREARSRTRSELAVPIMNRQNVIGTFNLESNKLDAYSERDLELVEIFAAHAAVAIERAQLYEEQRERRAIQRELRLARTVQEFFTPQRTRTVGSYKISGINYPSLEVTGDYHDYFPVGDGRVAFAVADVAGKGVPASIIMSCFRATLHAAAPDLRTALQITLRANRVLLETVRPQDFVTAFIGVIDGNTGEVTYCNAGHDAPILMSPNGDYRMLESGGPVLGVFDTPPMTEGRFVLGDEVLLCYTDGATEARSPDDIEYGPDRLIGALRDNINKPPASLFRSLFAVLNEFTQNAPQSDDTTYLVLKRK